MPDGYREANKDEHWRQDVKYYDKITDEWRERTASAGQAFSKLIRYAVPVDVLPTQEDAQNFAVVMVRVPCSGKWEPRFLLDIYGDEHGKRHVTLRDDRRTIEEYRYVRMPYAGELQRIVNACPAYGHVTGS